MNKFKLVICEDNESLTPVLESYCIELKRKYNYLEYEFWDFQKLLKIDNTYEERVDLILLDLLDESNTKDLLGVRILEIIKNRDIKIPIIVYSSLKDFKGTEININELKLNYPFAVFVQKFDFGQTAVKNELELKIKERLGEQFEVESDYIDEFNQQLYYFGRSSINQILFLVKQHYGITEERIKLFKLKSGFSGAILFKFSFNSTEYVLKFSKDVILLRSELTRAKSYYPLFPSRFFNYIEPKDFYTSSNDTMAIVIKLIPHTKTLFDYIRYSTSKEEIENIFNEVYFNYGLKDHYKTQRRANISWTNILRKFKNGRFVTISEVHNELQPLLSNFNLFEVKNFIENEDYKQLNPLKVTTLGAETLNHLDLHSKNILVQGVSSPFLIDTGVMDYDYWCFDICRLLVDLFINGVDYGTKEFYDISSIPRNLELAQDFINLKPIRYDTKNDRIIDSINWLTVNVHDIYADYFSLWELQLGLMKEFLQMSYRTGSIPHSKRALALELAYKCMIEAERNASYNSITPKTQTK